MNGGAVAVAQIQWPVGGISEGFFAFLVFFAARFSFNVLPCFFTLVFCGDLLDMATPSLRNVRMVVRPQACGDFGALPSTICGVEQMGNRRCLVNWPPRAKKHGQTTMSTA
jgi:hypothetical protein